MRCVPSNDGTVSLLPLTLSHDPRHAEQAARTLKHTAAQPLQLGMSPRHQTPISQPRALKAAAALHGPAPQARLHLRAADASMVVQTQVSATNEEAHKIVSFYRVQSLPSILLVDPVTGACLQRFQGFIDADRCRCLLHLLYLALQQH